MWNIITPTGRVTGVLNVDMQGRISGIQEIHGKAEGWLLPGFIDLHIHGGGGKDLMEGGDALQTLTKAHARCGTTSLLATTVTASPESLASVLSDVRAFMDKPRSADTSRVLGVHLEGPFVNPDKLGAQPPESRVATREEIDYLLTLADIRLITLAAEFQENLNLIPYLCEKNIRVQQGHTLATYEQSLHAMRCGAKGFAHLYNAMSGIHHREPGALAAALAHAEFAEIIPDFEHVHSGALLAARRAIPKLYGVTDACSAMGMPDGEYKLGTHTIYKYPCMSATRLKDGNLAASTLSMDQALRNFLSLGMTPEEASARLSLYPAEFLGLDDRGRIEPGAWADYVILDKDFELLEVVIEGVPVTLTSHNEGEL